MSNASIEDVISNPENASIDSLKSAAQQLLERADAVESNLKDAVAEVPLDGLSAASDLKELTDQYDTIAAQLGKVFLYWRKRGGSIRLLQNNQTCDLVGGGVEHLSDVMSMLGDVPETFDDPIEASEEIDRLEHAFDRDKWESYPKRCQQLILGCVATRARWLQSAIPEELLDKTNVEDRLDHLFPSLTKFSSEEEPGFVYGLGRDHTPDYGDSWREDALHWRQRLERRLNVETETSKSDWESFHYDTECAVLIGHLQSKERMEVIKESFGFEKVDVVVPSEPLEPLEVSVKRGRVDVIFCLTDHLNEVTRSLREACHKHDVPFVEVQRDAAPKELQATLQRQTSETPS